MTNDFPFLANLEILPEWEQAARRWLEWGGAALVLGGPDTGKSTLSRYLVSRAYAAGRPVGLLDLDLGQSHLGPPAALGLGLFPPLVPGDDSLFPPELYFIGQTSPLGALLEVAVGCRRLADQAVSRRVTRLVANTSGFIQGPGALRLKKAQVELLQPGLILALQRERELEPLLRGLGGKQSLTPSPAPPPSRGREKDARKRGPNGTGYRKLCPYGKFRLGNSAAAGLIQRQPPRPGDAAPLSGRSLARLFSGGRAGAAAPEFLHLGRPAPGPGAALTALAAATIWPEPGN